MFQTIRAGAYDPDLPAVARIEKRSVQASVVEQTHREHATSNSSNARQLPVEPHSAVDWQACVGHEDWFLSVFVRWKAEALPSTHFYFFLWATECQYEPGLYSWRKAVSVAGTDRQDMYAAELP